MDSNQTQFKNIRSAISLTDDIEIYKSTKKNRYFFICGSIIGYVHTSTAISILNKELDRSGLLVAEVSLNGGVSFTPCLFRFKGSPITSDSQIDNSKNTIIEENNYLSRKEYDYGCISVVQNHKREWAMISESGEFLVPFGRYDWIGGFDSGLLLVRSKGHGLYLFNVLALSLSNSDSFITNEEEIKRVLLNEYNTHPEQFRKWGIINRYGEEVVSLKYDWIDPFMGEERPFTNAIQGFDQCFIEFESLYGSDYYDENRDYRYNIDNCSSKSYSSDDDDNDDYSFSRFYDSEGNFRPEWLQDAIMDGEYVVDD